MHSYSIDQPLRLRVYATVGVVAFVASYFSATIPELVGIPGFTSFSVSFGLVFSIFLFAFDKWLWKLISGLPDLNGEWTAEGVSSYQPEQTGEPYKYTMKVQIKQTFSKIEVDTETENSTSLSTMAGFELDHAIPVFRYAFENVPLSRATEELQRHPGLVELRIYASEEMRGDYFSGKHRLRFGGLSMRRAR